MEDGQGMATVYANLAYVRHTALKMWASRHLLAGGKPVPREACTAAAKRLGAVAGLGGSLSLFSSSEAATVFSTFATSAHTCFRPASPPS